jgi:glycine cleavage system H protein
MSASTNLMNDADNLFHMSYEIRDGLFYTDSHEWIMIDGGRAVVGMTDYAQDELGNVVYVELPAVGSMLARDSELGAMESVKTIEPIYSPIEGKVVAVNESLPDAPDLINKSPYDEGWIAELELSDECAANGLMDADTYRELLGKLTI